jgi:hypothetical protein
VELKKVKYFGQLSNLLNFLIFAEIRKQIAVVSRFGTFYEFTKKTLSWKDKNNTCKFIIMRKSSTETFVTTKYEQYIIQQKLLKVSLQRG